MVIQLFRKEISSIHQAAFLVGAAGLLSRILGVLRDRLLASHFGASRTLDVYYASFQIPDFLFTVFLVGAASAAILPTFIAYWEEDKEKARVFFGGLLSLFSFGAALVALIAFWFAPLLVRAIAPGFGEEARNLMAQMTRVMLLSPLFLGVSNIFSSVVQAQRKFFVFALTSLVYNLGIIFGILFFVPLMGPAGLAWGVVLGAFAHMAVQVPALVESGVNPIWRSWGRVPGLMNVFLLSFPRVIALSLNQIIMITLIALGSFLAAGNIAIFQFSNNLRYLPIGIIGVSYAVAAFPKLTASALAKSRELFYGDFTSMAETVLFWVVPIAFITVLLRAHIVRIALGAKAFTWEDTRLTAAALGILALTMITESLTPLLLRGFYALGNTRLPLFVSLFTAFSVISSAPFFVAMFTTHRASGRFIANLMKVGDLSNVGVLGLVLAFTLGNIIDIVFLSLAFRSETKKYFGGGIANGTLFAALRIFFASFMAAVVGYGVLYLLSFKIALTTFWGVVGQASLTFLTVALFYAGSMYLMGSDEIRSLVAAAKARFRGREALPATLEDYQEPPLK